jgi:hypothetical protein
MSKDNDHLVTLDLKDQARYVEAELEDMGAQRLK